MELPEKDREWIWSGAGNPSSLDDFFRWLEQRTYKVHVRVLLARYRSYNLCPECLGTRLQPEALAIQLEGRTLPELAALSLEQLRAWLRERPWTPRQREVAGHLLDELAERVEVLHRVGLDYLTLDRQARTLSGGETQRIHLAAALGSGLTSTLYVLDEPTIGLHPQDSEKLLSLLRDLAARGNTVLVVEHDRTLIRGADHVIDLGPAAGEHGGQVVAEGPIETILASAELAHRPLSAGAPADPGPPAHGPLPPRAGVETLSDELSSLPRVSVRGARAHNLKDVDVDFPLGALVAVTGVSGSGKSTLIENVVYGTYQRSRGVVDVEPGECDLLSGLEGVVDVTLVDQRPLGRSSRSNPITYIKTYDEIRKLFAATSDAKARRITPAHFSFNVDKGRCPTCEGTGITEVDMQFMAPVTVPCETCQGHRFRPEVLAVRYRGLNISEVLDLTVEDAIAFFADQKRLARRLSLLTDVGPRLPAARAVHLDALGRRGPAPEARQLPRPPGHRGQAALPLRRADHRAPPGRHRPALPDAPAAGAAGGRRGRRRAQPRPHLALRLDHRPRARRRRPRRRAALLRPSRRVPRPWDRSHRGRAAAAPALGGRGGLTDGGERGFFRPGALFLPGRAKLRPRPQASRMSDRWNRPRPLWRNRRGRKPRR